MLSIKLLQTKFYYLTGFFSKYFTHICVTQRNATIYMEMFITVFTKVSHWNILSQTNPIYTSHFNYLSSITMLRSRLRLVCLEKYSGFSTGILYRFFITFMRTACTTHVTVFDSITLVTVGEAYKLQSLSLCNLLHLPITSILSGQHILNTSVCFLPLAWERILFTHTDPSSIHIWLATCSSECQKCLKITARDVTLLQLSSPLIKILEPYRI
jgi:hypothetical protein